MTFSIFVSFILVFPYLVLTVPHHFRYIPLLQETFSFPQSLGILGGKPGTSTYIVGVQEDKALYLDPHEVQPVCLSNIEQELYLFRNCHLFVLLCNWSLPNDCWILLLLYLMY